MKRKFAVLFCAVVCAAAMALTMAGCGSGEATNDVTLTNISSAIQSQGTGTYSHSMNISDLKTTYNIDSGDVLQFVAKHAGDPMGNAMVMIEATSDDAAHRIEEKLNSFVGMFSRVDMDTVVRHGKYVALFSDANDEKMAAAFSEFIVAE